MISMAPKNPPEFTSRDKMQEWIEHRLAGLKVRSIDFVCNSNRPHSALCVIEGDSSTMRDVSMRVGGTMFGAVTTSLFFPLSPSFSCAMRPDGGASMTGRCECRPEKKCAFTQNVLRIEGKSLSGTLPAENIIN